MGYQAAETVEPSVREIEPIGLYSSQHWHVVAYCRLRRAFRKFHLDNISSLALLDELFTTRPETLQQYWADEAKRIDEEKVVIHFTPSSLLPAQVQHLHDTKHQYGWVHEQHLPDGRLELLFLIGSLPYLAAWLLPYVVAIEIVDPLYCEIIYQSSHNVPMISVVQNES
ncbi:WYL domain-containing protein [Dyadobacter sp. CY261]|uniref:helix-turn-helix transcriptional regulator n=1 Tax=Dyadobacter sp. CY261 TaxID=2907203 RepID=UPI001F24A5F2|nr:WYL domain-containing protein [Dyadobacter sp. CY261]MCF0075541.1 WYL domain-containing protein [Dyadobacter sp. CY261]